MLILSVEERRLRTAQKLASGHVGRRTGMQTLSRVSLFLPLAAARGRGRKVERGESEADIGHTHPLTFILRGKP